MAIIQHDIFLSNYYQTEYEQYLYYNLPYTQRLFVNLYIPLVNQSVFKNTNAIPTLNQITQGAIERPFDKTAGGMQYLLINNIPIYLVDASSLAESELKIDDTFIRFAQQSSFVARTYNIIPQFVGGIMQFINPYSNTIIENRLFEITGEEKFSAYAYNVNDTLYKLSLQILNKEFNPNISNTLYYSQALDTLVSYSELQFLQQSQSIYMYSINQLRNYYKTYYYGEFPIGVSNYIINGIYSIAQSYSINFQQYMPASFDALISNTESIFVQYFQSDSILTVPLYLYNMNYNTFIAYSVTTISNSYFYTLSVTMHSLSYYMKNNYQFISLSSITTFEEGFEFWNQLLIASNYLNMYQKRYSRVVYSNNSYF